MLDMFVTAEVSDIVTEVKAVKLLNKDDVLVNDDVPGIVTVANDVQLLNMSLVVVKAGKLGIITVANDVQATNILLVSVTPDMLEILNDVSCGHPRHICLVLVRLLLDSTLIAVTLVDVEMLPPKQSVKVVATGHLIVTSPVRFLQLLNMREQFVAFGKYRGHDTPTSAVLPLNMPLYGLLFFPSIKGVVKTPASMISTWLLSLVHFCKNAELQSVVCTLLASHSHTFGDELICVHVASVRVVSEDGS